MPKGSDNPFPSVLVVEGTTPASPSAGDQRVFIDSADHHFKRVNSGGTVTDIEAGAGGTVTHTAGALAASELVVGNAGADIKTVAATDGQVPIGKTSDGSVNLATLTASDNITITNGAASITIKAARSLVFGITIDGGGSAITTGVKGFVRIPVSCTITKITVLSIDASATAGSIVIDVWKDIYANYPPTVADTITASAKPTLSSANKAEDSTLTGWTKSVTAGDVVGFNVDSATTVTKVALEIEASVP